MTNFDTNDTGENPFAEILEQKQKEIQREKDVLTKRKNDLAESAKKAYDENDFRLAQTHMTELLKLDPENSDYLQFKEILHHEISKLPPVAGDLRIWSVNSIDYPFRWCPPGTFMMGSPAPVYDQTPMPFWKQFFVSPKVIKPGEAGRDDDDDDERLHEVTLTRGFWMLATPVTQMMWQNIMNTSVQMKAVKADCRCPSEIGPFYPMCYVNYLECIEFCQRLSRHLNCVVNLPTEAQWEYACRAGTTGPYAGKIEEMGWFVENSNNQLHPVGQKAPNAWGLYDMHGNIWEWCLDWYGSYAKSSTSDPKGPDFSWARVNRGGDRDSSAKYCRSADRNKTYPEFQNDTLGFRIVLTGTDK